jgi:uncharacterized membrane protein YuzA (DUF378 family)
MNFWLSLTGGSLLFYSSITVFVYSQTGCIKLYKTPRICGESAGAYVPFHILLGLAGLWLLLREIYKYKNRKSLSTSANEKGSEN